MNNKGFSVLELVISFSICMIIVFTLFQVILSLREVYEKSEIKTSLLNKQNIVVDLIYDDILEKELVNIESCSGYCIKFSFDDGTVKELNYTNNIIKYGEYATELVGSVGDIKVEVLDDGVVLYAHLPIKHKLFNDDFGIKIVHLVNE